MATSWASADTLPQSCVEYVATWDTIAMCNESGAYFMLDHVGCTVCVPSLLGHHLLVSCLLGLPPVVCLGLLLECLACLVLLVSLPLHVILCPCHLLQPVQDEVKSLMVVWQGKLEPMLDLLQVGLPLLLLCLSCPVCNRNT